MKKIILITIIALLTITLFSKNAESTSYLDFDDYDPIEIVKI